MPHTVFISYHHGGDAAYKEELLALNRRYNIFIDGSVNTRDIDDRLPDQTIRQIIRDDYLRDTTVTIVLVGTGTWGRKHGVQTFMRFMLAKRNAFILNAGVGQRSIRVASTSNGTRICLHD